MPCTNHPQVETGLDACARCGKSFCIDCLVVVKAGTFCIACDKELNGPPMPAVPKPVPKGTSCRNHAEVFDALNPCAGCAGSFCPDCLVEIKGRRWCAACKVNAVKDIQSGVDGTGLQLASIGARFCAVFIDGFAVNIIIVPLFIILGILIAALQPGPDSVAMPLLIFGFYGIIFAAIFCYHGFMLQWKGQTLGKMAMKIKVVTPEGGSITPGQAWIRTLVWFLLHGCLIDYIPAFFNKEKLAIHDMAARTRVVRLD